METKNTFIEGKIFAPLIKFTLPVLMAMFLQAMYGAVDLMVVGKFGTAADVSAVSTGSHIMQTVTGIIVGLAMGVTINVGQKIGERKPEEAGKAIGSGICIFAVAALAMTVLLVGFAGPASQIMKAPAEAFRATTAYVRICAAGSVFIVAYNILGSIFRGLGDSKTPLITVLIACVVNIIGDLLLVAGFGMASDGAAIATVFAQAVSVFLSLWMISRKKLPFAFSKKLIRFHKGMTASIIKLGAPIALQDFLVNVSFLVITAIINSMGVVPSAGVGVAEKLCGFIMLVPSSFAQAVSAFVAQNYGAGRLDRAKKSLFYGIAISLGFGIIMFSVSFFRGDLMASLFANDPAIIQAAWDYMKAYAIDCLFTAEMFCMTGYFNGRGKTTFVMAQGIFSAFFIRIPVSFIMSRMVPLSLFKVGLATPAATLTQIVMCVIYYRILEKSSAGTIEVGK